MCHSDEFWHLTDWVGHVQPVAALGRSLGKCESPSWRSHIQAVETMGLELLTQCCGLWFFAVVCLFAALLTVNCWTLLCSFVGHLVSVQRGSLSFTLTWSCCWAALTVVAAKFRWLGCFTLWASLSWSPQFATYACVMPMPMQFHCISNAMIPLISTLITNFIWFHKTKGILALGYHGSIQWSKFSENLQYFGQGPWHAGAGEIWPGWSLWTLRCWQCLIPRQLDAAWRRHAECWQSCTALGPSMNLELMMFRLATQISGLRVYQHHYLLII